MASRDRLLDMYIKLELTYLLTYLLIRYLATTTTTAAAAAAAVVVVVSGHVVLGGSFAQFPQSGGCNAAPVSQRRRLSICRLLRYKVCTILSFFKGAYTANEMNKNATN